MDVAITSVQAGVTDYNSAIRRTMKAAAQDGLRVKYPNSGLTRRLDSAVRQNVLDGVRAVNNDVLRQLGNEYGADGVEISAHALCATDHLPYQGLQFSNREFEELQNTLDRPFGMWNCKHTVFPIILGVSVPAHDADELRMYRENSNAEIEIDGRKMTRYEWTQEQRRIETAVRAQKDIAIAARASGDDFARREAQAHINDLQARYDKISKAAGLDAQHERMSVSGFRAVKTVEQLKNPVKIGIIEAKKDTYHRMTDSAGNEKYQYLKTDVIQKMDKPDDIVKHFQYKYKWGDLNSPISSGFSSLKFEVQKEAAEGIEWARETFNLDSLPNVIDASSIRSFGEYNESSRVLTLRKSIKIDDAFSTAVHEMTHYTDQIHGHISKDVVEQARKNLGYKARSKIFTAQKERIVGYGNIKDINDPHELVAYSLESYATNRTNELATEISRLWLERMKK